MAVDVQESSPFPRPKNRLAKEEPPVGLDAKIIQDGWENIRVLGGSVHIHVGQRALRMKEQQRDTVMPKGIQVLPHLQFLSMIRGNDKQGVGIPRLLPGSGKEL